MRCQSHNLYSVAFLVLVVFPVYKNPNAQAQIDGLFGTWQGTWFVDEKFSSSGPYGTPPYPSVDVTFLVNEFDPDRQNYGQIAVAGTPSGDISSLTLDAAVSFR